MPRNALSLSTSRDALRSYAGASREAFQGLTRTVPGRLAVGFGATLLVAAAAHIAFPLPFTPVPFILTPLAVLGVGLAFGPMGGFAVLAAYLLEGACGLPVFSPTGAGSVAQLLGPTGGYLMAYPLVAMVAGLAGRVPARVPRFAAAALTSSAAIALLFAMGFAWFAHWNSLLGTHALSTHAMLMATVLPFLPGEMVKVLAAAGIYSTLHRQR